MNEVSNPGSFGEIGSMRARALQPLYGTGNKNKSTLINDHYANFELVAMGTTCDMLAY